MSVNSYSLIGLAIVSCVESIHFMQQKIIGQLLSPWHLISAGDINGDQKQSMLKISLQSRVQSALMEGRQRG